MKKAVFKCIEEDYRKFFSESLNILEYSVVEGGSSNHSFFLKTNKGHYFLKLNSEVDDEDFFKIEHESLIFLKKKTIFRIPETKLFGKIGIYKYLLMEYIASGYSEINFWRKFAESLAHLHKNTAQQFGFAFDNYIGQIFQPNKWMDNWVDFFISQRLEPQVKIAFSKGYFSHFKNNFDALFKVIESMKVDIVPSLIHGDLWSGNFSVDENSFPCVFDPSLYYGNREMDIAMSRLFGGFDNLMYNVYQEILPMEKGWEERTYLWNIYPLLIHVNIFGKPYVNSVKTSIERFL